MNSVPTSKKIKHIRVVKVLTFIVLLYILSATVVFLRLGSMRDKVALQIAEQQTLLIGLSETTARNGADSVTESIIKDCNEEERANFDNLLGRLDKGLSQSELLKLENLFGSCGSFFAERKALMVSRLNREIEVYVTYVEQLNQLTTFAIDKDYKVDGWRQLVEQEKRQSELFTSLVTQQDTIISKLVSGTESDSQEMKTILQDARETQDMLLLNSRQTAEMRATLIPL